VDDLPLDPEVVMRELLARHPEARLTAISPEGTVIPLPASVPLGPGHVPGGLAGMKAYVPEDRVLLIQAFDETIANGMAQVTVRLAHDPGIPVTVFMIDLRETHGIVLDVGVSSLGNVLQREVRAQDYTVPRLARIHKGTTAEIIDIDDATTAILGWEREEIVGHRSLEFIHPDDHGLAIDSWAMMMAEPDALRRVRLRHRSRDGQWIWFELIQGHCVWQGRDAIVCDMVDISKEMATQQVLEAREQLLRQLTQALPLGVFQIDADRHVVYTNDRLFEVVGHPRAQTLAEQLSAVVPDDRLVLEAAVEAVLRDGRDSDADLQLSLPDEPAFRTCHLSLRPLTRPDGEVTGAVGCVSDATESTRLRRELEQRATFDALTRCYNRASIMAVLDSVLLEARGAATGTAVMFVDLDLFKDVNDRYGHRVGDELLSVVATRMGNVSRGTTTVGRLGGDEFLLVCPGIATAAEAAAIGDRVAESLRDDISLSVGTVSVRASVGVAFGRGRPVSAESLVAEADAAMYDSKRTGTGTAVMHPLGAADPALHNAESA
jgi:diguanylate cyclase (GGDEF)-like protein/PAS domain S-box-containing protein